MLRVGENLKNVGTVKAIAFDGERKVYDFKTTRHGTPTYYANGFVAKAGTDEWGGEVA